MKQPIKEFSDSYKAFRDFYAEMRDYKVANMRPTGFTDADLDAIVQYAQHISAWALYIKGHC